MRLPRFLMILLLALLMGACGGMKFNRAPGAFKYRALPVGSDIKVVASAQELPQPTAEIGRLSWVVETRTQPNADEAKAIERFRKFGARYGCDAVVGAKSETKRKDSTKKIKKMGADGKYVYEVVKTAQYTHTYTARCVRTAKAPGGLVASANSAAQPGGAASPTTALNLPSTNGTGSNGTGSNGKGSNGKGGKGRSKGAARKVEKDADVSGVWLALSPYSGSFLKNWRAALSKPPTSAYDVLAAFTELMVQVSGPTGIWRKTVPNEWFGCPANPAQEQCKKLETANAEFRAWDALQRSMERQTPSSAKGWIKRNKRRLLGYLERYVPSSPNLTGLQQTPLYIDKMR